MRNLRVEVVSCAMVSFTNKQGERIVIPITRTNKSKKWRAWGTYLKYGTSKSDPEYAAAFGLPHGWQPDNRILRAIERANAR